MSGLPSAAGAPAFAGIRHHGSCLCGAVRYAVDCEIRDVSHCHCGMCRKAHGAAFATYANVPAAGHRFTHGAGALRTYRSSATVERLFCAECGSPMLWRDAARLPGIASLPLGSLDSPIEVPVQRHIFVASKASWHQIDDCWPQSA